jgi:hypothetical protein
MERILAPGQSGDTRLHDTSADVHVTGMVIMLEKNYKPQDS